MPKRYQCEFCQKSFQDTPVARRRHLQGAGHQRNRRLHYESFSTPERTAPIRQGRAEILYSELSGEEILQQWLSCHPEVVERHEEQRRKSKSEEEEEEEGEEGKLKDGARTEKTVNQSSLLSRTAPSLTQTSGQNLLPPYLQPYRMALPPSLLPSSSMTTYPHSLLPNEVSGWG